MPLDVRKKRNLVYGTLATASPTAGAGCRREGEMGELLGALGLAWPRVLLYPGGLFALGASWLLGRWLAPHTAEGRANRRPMDVGQLCDMLPPLATLTLLPFAPARGFPYGLDLFVALGLLEWPRLRRAAPAELARGALLRGYAPLALAALLMAEGAGGLGLSGLLTWPAGWLDRTLLLAGAALWLLSLPRLIAGALMDIALRLRALGLLLVGGLPLVGALAALAEGRIPGWLAGWIVPPTAMLLAGLVLGGLHALVQRPAHV